MKKVFNFKSLTILLFFALSIGQMQAADVQQNAIIYMDNSAAGWDYSNIYFVINSTNGYPMTAVANTKLYVHKRSAGTWSGYSNVRFFAATSSWGGDDANMGSESNMASYGANLTNTQTDYGFNGNNYYVIKLDKAGEKTNSSTRANLSTSYIGNAVTSMNKTITVKAKVSTDGGSSYSEATSPGTLSASSNKFTAYNSCSSATSLSSGTISCGYTAATTLTAADASGYAFVGWYNSSGTQQTTSKTLTIYPTATATYYAYYKAETTYTITIANSVNATTSTVQVGSTPIQITAPDIDGYIFSTWSSMPSGVTKTSGNLTDATISITATKAATVTANYTAKTRVCLYYGNPNGWATIYAYAWDNGNPSDANAAWHGVNITSNTVTNDCRKYYYYEYYKEDHPNWNRIIFNDNGSNQTDDITFSNTTNNGQYYVNDAWTATPGARWVLAGDMSSPAWSTTAYPLTCSGTTSGYVDIALAANTDYNFKFIDVDNSTWYGVTTATKITYSNKGTAQTMNNTAGGSANQTIRTAGAGTYRFSWNITNKQVTVTYPTSYTITFGKGTGGATITATGSVSGSLSSGNYVTSGENVTFTQTASAGYTFSGWYTTKDTGGSTVSGMSTSDNVLDNVTANKTVWSRYTPKTYTVSFNNNGGSGATPENITVTYGQPYGTLPAGPTPPGADQFVGWSTGASSGPIITSSTTVTTASNHTLYARFESTFTVTVQYKCGTDVLRAQTTTHASETSVAAEITAPEILGYAFVNWTGDNATFADATSATTTVNVTSATTIVANYEVVPMVYFKNNPGWDDVFVTFDCGFSGEVPSLSGKPYYKMTQLGTSDIYYCVIPSTYTASDYASWAWYIAFDNKGTGYNASTHRGTYAFNSGEFIGRKDFDPNATMFIPYVGDSKSLNGGTTYQTGCWLQYNTNYSAYKVRVNTYVQGSGGSEVQNIELRSEVAGATEFKAKVYLGNANYTYGVMLYKDYMKNTNDIWYTNVNNEANTITSATTTLPWSWEPGTESWQRCRVKTEALGDYIFTVSFATGRPMVDIEYPVTVGDFRLVYKDRATWNTTHSASWQQASLVFKKQANRKDTASFFISYGSSPTVELQKCTAIDAGTGAETWTKQGSDISLSGITSKGVYNFIVTQNSTGTSATAAAAGAYTGKFYVRTDASDGGWNNYKSTANAMTYTEYSMTHGGSSGPYSYYFMRHVNDGQNIKFIVANDYSLCLSDTLISDTYANEWIECEANVRFTYNHTNNEIHRAYISGSSIIADRFLVLEGDNKLFDADGNALTGAHKVEDLNDYEMNFVDDQNWIYETTVQAQPLERVKLTAKFIRMFGRNTSTLPTPAIMPSTSRSLNHPTGRSVPILSPIHATPASIQSIGYWPMVKVHQKIKYSSARKIGKASHLLVTTESIRSVTVTFGAFSV